jgi:hypothetical protein
MKHQNTLSVDVHLAGNFWHKIGVPVTPGFAVAELHNLAPPNNLPHEEFAVFVALSCWQLWKARNAAVFRRESTNIRQLLGACKSAAEQWRARFPRKKRHIADKWCEFFAYVMNA